ncbi:MAG: zinc ribbon domain-containing protein [Dokdonella sp.]
MPIYHYVPESTGCATCSEGLDALQRLADAPLTRCSGCGAALVRVISAAQVVCGQAHRLTETHAAKHGFTQYRRAGKGVYEKTAGSGPKIISGD